MKFLFLIVISFLLINCDNSSSSNTISGTLPHRLIEQRMYKGDSLLSQYWLYEYDNDNYLLKTKNYDSLDIYSSYLTYEYNSKGQRIESFSYYPHGELKYHTVYTYGTDECLEGGTFSNADGEVLSTSTYEVDPDSKNLLSYSNGFSSGPVYRKVFQYNSNGNRTKSLALNTDGDTTGYSDYKYFNGVLDSVIQFNANGEIESIRVFTFEQKSCNDDIFESGVW